MTDAELAASIAESAGKLLVETRAGGRFAGPRLGPLCDHLANEFILDALRTHRPDDAILSEESADSAERLTRERVWIVDPLDGTREYCEHRDDWAVHIGLAIGGHAAIGAVALPCANILLRSDAPPAPARHSGAPRMLVSRTRPPEQALRVAAAIGAELVPMGSAGAKAGAVIRGEAEIYLHAGGQSEWDNCAPVAIALAAGLHAARLDGSPIVYNQRTPSVPDLLICRPELRDAIHAALA